MKPKIAVIGSANVDFIMQAPHLPVVGETVTDCTYMQTFGGKGANQAVAAARAGGDVTFVAVLGNDPHAQTMIADFKRNSGIRTDWITVEQDIPSGAALVMFDANGDNYLTVAPGSNYRLTPERVKHAEPVIAESTWLILQMEIPTDAIETAIALANKHGTKVLLNYAPVRDMSVQLTSAVHALVVNESEAAALSAEQVPGTDIEQAKNVAAKLRERGSHSFVCLTLGKCGSVVSAPGVCEHVPAFAVDPVDATAAGDTFCGALAVALGENRPLLEAVRFAGAASALAVTGMGAQPSIPRRTDIDAFLSRQHHPR